MPGKKQLLAELCSRTGLARALLQLGPGSRNALVVLAYHRVLDIGDEQSFPADPELVSATVADFEWQMRFLRRHFSPITFRQAIDCLERGIALPARSVIVTFDDGHLDNYLHAFPILQSLGMPATIFLSTGYVDTRLPFWFDQVARLLYRAPPGRLDLSTIEMRIELSDIASRRRATEVILGRLKRIPESDRLSSLRELESRLDRNVVRSEDSEPFALSWSQVLEMSQSGIEFGSHTVSHPILSNLEPAQLARELGDSRRSIELHTGQPADVIAYPIGKRFAYSDSVIAACKAAGYRVGVSYESGINKWPLSSPFELRRLAIERYTDRAMFESLLTLPRIFG
ncbi:MAG: polysaccharide deacetylase family protein [Sinobacteraceae bacterium]|nr:polysaccharide deacetylase family protein [Nevskiaceae bacterium]MCP5470724.1 polysaccharide deacetylase family protein [Nevskiaceae bacterium]